MAVRRRVYHFPADTCHSNLHPCMRVWSRGKRFSFSCCKRGLRLTFVEMIWGGNAICPSQPLGRVLCKSVTSWPPSHITTSIWWILPLMGIAVVLFFIYIISFLKACSTLRKTNCIWNKDLQNANNEIAKCVASTCILDVFPCVLFNFWSWTQRWGRFFWYLIGHLRLLACGWTSEIVNKGQWKKRMSFFSSITTSWIVPFKIIITRVSVRPPLDVFEEMFVKAFGCPC